MQIGNYTVVRKLGKGGMGAVYKVTAPGSDRFFALKLLDPFEIMEDIIGLPRLKEIFFAEADIMRQLHSPFVVMIHDVGEDEEKRPYFVMECLCRNLGEMLGEGFWMDNMSRIISPAVVLEYGRQLVEGLAVLHDAGIVHRDIKPFNLLVSDENQVKICDFGMALDNGNSLVGDANMIIGSPFYAAPEQNSQSRSIDGRADLYSAAVIMFRMLTGAFPSPKLFPLSSVNPVLDNTWDDFFKRAIRRLPDERFQSSAEMLAEIEGLNRRYLRRDIRDEWPGIISAGPALRSVPENIAGVNACRLLGLSEQFQPLFFYDTALAPSDDGHMVVDPNHNLCWLQPSFPSRFTLPEAETYIRQLNRDEAIAGSSWRLPTISELLSLLRPARSNLLSNCFSRQDRWLWSSDEYGRRDHWYLDCAMGFVGHLDSSCTSHILAVSSSSWGQA